MKQLYLLMIPLLVISCGDRDERFDSWQGVVGPKVVGERVVYLDNNFDEAVIFTPAAGDKTPDYERVAIGADSTFVGILDKSQELLLKSGATDELMRLDPASGNSVTYPLDAPYDRFVIRDDPPMAGAYFSASAGSAETLFLNQGEVAFVDLEKEDDAVRKVVLKTYGGAPIGLDIAPRVPAAGGGRLFAFVRWNSYLSLVDVERPDFQPISIPLKAPDTDAQVFPEALQFIAGNNRLSAYFLAQGNSDLYAIDLAVDQLTGGASGVSVNVFPAAAGARTFKLYTRPEGDTGIIVLSPSQRMVSVVHPESSDVKLYPLEGLTPTALNVFQMVSPETGVEEQFAFIYNNTGADKSYYYVELHRIAEKKSKAFHRYTTLPAGVRKVVMQGDDRFLVLHSGGQSPMSQVTVSNGSVVSVGGGLTISNEQFSADGSIMYVLATKNYRTYVVAFDVETLQGRDIDVSYGQVPTGLSLLEEAGLLVAYDTAGKVLTVLPADFKSKDSESAVQFFAPTLYGLEH
jgi:hypothetical protein